MSTAASLSAARRIPPRRVYIVELIHRIHDWNATLTFEAPDSKTARKWALRKMGSPGYWLATKASQHKATGSDA